VISNFFSSKASDSCVNFPIHTKLIKTQGTKTWQIENQRHEGLMIRDMKIWGHEIWRPKDIKTLKVCSKVCSYVGLTVVEKEFVSWEVKCVEPLGHWWKFPKTS
jgi:homospermidine synthase